MRLLFLGTCTLGDRSNAKICNPFEPLKQFLRMADIVFVNIEGNITTRDVSMGNPRSIPFLRSDGRQLLSLKRLIPQTPIIINNKSENMLSAGELGVRDTERFLTRHDFFFNPAVFKPLMYANLCVFNFIDSDLMTNLNLMNHILPVQIGSERPNSALFAVIKMYKRWQRNIVVTMKFSFTTNYPSIAAEKFAEVLIDNGVSIVFGYGSRDIPYGGTRTYGSGIIIFGLGDLVNCHVNSSLPYNNRGEVCTFNTFTKDACSARIYRQLVEDCLVPL